MMGKEYEHYYDGISPEMETYLAGLSLEDLEVEIEKEKKECEKMEEW